MTFKLLKVLIALLTIIVTNQSMHPFLRVFLLSLSRCIWQCGVQHDTGGITGNHVCKCVPEKSHSQMMKQYSSPIVVIDQQSSQFLYFTRHSWPQICHRYRLWKCFSCKYLSETLVMLPNSSFLFRTSFIWPFSGPFFTFSRPIR